jgi:hypothetical protein
MSDNDSPPPDTASDIKHFQRLDLSDGRQIGVYEMRDGSITLGPTFGFNAEVINKTGCTMTIKITPQSDAGTAPLADRAMKTGGRY